MSGKKDDKLKCSFCGKTQDQVTRLIAGPVSYTHLTLPTT